MDNSGSTRWKGSQEYWEKLAEIYSGMFRDNPRSYVFVPLADALYHAGMASEAADTLEMGLAMLPNSRAGMILLARLRNETGDIAGAKALLLDIVSRWPDNTAAVTMLCGIYKGEGLFAEAKRLASVLLDYFPDAKQAQKLYGKYSALAENRMEPSPIRATLPVPAQAGQELEPEPDIELELEPEPAVLAPQGEVESSTAPEREENLVEALDEDKGETRSRKRRGQAAGRASSEKQLSLVKLESILLGISKLRK